MTDRYAHIREALEALDAAGGDWISWETAPVKYAKASQPDTIRALLAERDELAKDAARYRWLRDKAAIATDNEPVVCDSTPSDRECLFGATLDTEIDRAMGAEPA